MSSQSVLPRRSGRLATILPASHWISIGYDEDAAQLMEELQNVMKKYCDGDDDNKIELSGRFGGILSHHDMLLPHWQKLFKTIHGRNSVIKVEIAGISLPIPVLDIMFPVLQSINLESLTLYHTGLGNDGLQCLISFLEHNSTLLALWIVADINSTASSLSKAIEGHPRLDIIVLMECGLNDATILRKNPRGVQTERVDRTGNEQSRRI